MVSTRNTGQIAILSFGTFALFISSPPLQSAPIEPRLGKRAMANLTAFPPIPLEQFDSSDPPFTSSELWERIRALMMAYEGNITPDDVERVFGIQLTKESYSDGSGFYYYKKGPPGAWYNGIGVFYSLKSKSSYFSFDWKQNAFHGSYLRNDYVRYTLPAIKWKLSSIFRHHGTSADFYCYNKHIATMLQNDDLVYSVSFGMIKDDSAKCIALDER